MTKKELQEYSWLMKSIDYLEDKLLEAETKATRMTQVLTDEPRGGSINPDKMTNRVIEIIEYNTTINAKLKEAYALADRIEKAIAGLPPREQMIIRLRYIERKKWEEVAVEIHYEWAQMHRIHKDILIKLKRSDKPNLT